MDPNQQQGTTTPSGGQGNTTPPGGQGIPTPPAGQPNTPPAQTFTQADLDRVVAERLAREKGKFADYDQLKERAEQWDKFVAESATDQQKAVNAAREEGEKAATAKVRGEFGGRLVEAHVTAAAAGRMSPEALTALLAGIDKTAFLTADGDVDKPRITKFIDGIAPATTTTTPASIPGGFGQGPRDGAPRLGLSAGEAEYERRHAPGQVAPLFT